MNILRSEINFLCTNSIITQDHKIKQNLMSLGLKLRKFNLPFTVLSVHRGHDLSWGLRFTIIFIRTHQDHFAEIMELPFIEENDIEGLG